MQALHALVLSECVVLLALSATAVQGQEKKALGKDIDVKTVAAYENLGAVYGGLSNKYVDFGAGEENARDDLPGFQLMFLPNSKLPGVAVPFGLDLSGCRLTDAKVKDLAHLTNLTTLYLNSNAGVTDEGLKELAPLTNLTMLSLNNTGVTDAGLKDLTPLKNLTTLDLFGTEVTDAGLKHLTFLNKLATLRLTNTRVTDAGLKELTPLKNLITLDLGGTRVTDAGLTELAILQNLSTLDFFSTVRGEFLGSMLQKPRVF